jgi:hypothetical protein
VRQQIGQDVAFLGPQRDRHAGPVQRIALGIEEIGTKTVIFSRSLVWSWKTGGSEPFPPQRPNDSAG